MNQGLLEAFRLNAWATKTLIAACRDLSIERLTHPGARYGSILATLNHVVLSDAGYVASLTGIRPQWATDGNETRDFGELEARVDETTRLWEKLLSEPLDTERLVTLDKGTYECDAGIVVAQALHHGNAHREQVCAALKRIGIEPPDVQPWAYADANGRSRWLSPED